jgi:hypothetical protein
LPGALGAVGPALVVTLVAVEYALLAVALVASVWNQYVVPAVRPVTLQVTAPAVHPVTVVHGPVLLDPRWSV